MRLACIAIGLVAAGLAGWQVGNGNWVWVFIDSTSALVWVIKAPRQ